MLATLLCGSGAVAFAGSEPGPNRIAAASTMPAEASYGDRQTARYFTINQVLAALEKGGPSVQPSTQQLAATGVFNVPSPTADAPAAVDSDEPFGFSTFSAPEGPLWVKWRKLEVELADEAGLIARCRAEGTRCTHRAAQKYLALIAEARQLPERARIAHINRAINAAVRYTSDQDQFGVPDQWTAPLATLNSSRGDCEDYAIAKFVALRDAGFAVEDVRLLIVHDRRARQDHAVAGVRLNGHWLMLDNRHNILLESKDAQHFVPLFELDRQGVKLFAAPYDRAPANVPAQAATGQADTPAPAATANEDMNAESLGLRLDTFEPPQLRGKL